MVLGSAGCSGGSGSDDGEPQGCVPSRAGFESEALPIIESKCSECHGAEPEHGAPFSLLDYSALVRGSDGTRIVDRMVFMLSESLMPPPDKPQPSAAERGTLIGWASCGASH